MSSYVKRSCFIWEHRHATKSIKLFLLWILMATCTKKSFTRNWREKLRRQDQDAFDFCAPREKNCKFFLVTTHGSDINVDQDCWGETEIKKQKIIGISVQGKIKPNGQQGKVGNIVMWLTSNETSLRTFRLCIIKDS